MNTKVNRCEMFPNFRGRDMSTLLRGPKVSSRHQSYTEAAKIIIDFGQKSDDVRKVVLGPISNFKGKSKKLKLRPNQSGVQVDVLANNQMQIIYLIGDTDKIVSALYNISI